MRRILIAGLLVLMALPPAAAVQASPARTEVDRAAEEAERAERELAEAQRRVDEWAARRGTVEDQLVAALFAHEQANGRLEATTFALIDLRERIGTAEGRLRQLRSATEERAVAAYMSGSMATGLSIWSAPDFERSVLLEETAAAARRAEGAHLERLMDGRRELETLHGEFRTTEEQLRGLRENLDAQTDTLRDLFAQVDASLAQSYEQLEMADAVYQSALTELTAAERRRAARAGVESWRSLVERYFTADRVEEALGVMWCESRGNPDAIHPDSGATGLFQFLAGTWTFSSAGAGFGGASRYDAEANIAAAAWLVDYSIRTGHPGGAWGHWVCQP